MPFGAEVRVAADFGAELLHHGLVGIGHEQHRVRHARIERMNRLRAHRERHLLIEPQVLRRRQADGDAIALKAGGDDARFRLEREARRSAPVSFCTKRAKQRAPLPHISPALPSLL